MEIETQRFRLEIEQLRKKKESQKRLQRVEEEKATIAAKNAELERERLALIDEMEQASFTENFPQPEKHEE